jgi:hypothetical protein
MLALYPAEKYFANHDFCDMTEDAHTLKVMLNRLAGSKGPMFSHLQEPFIKDSCQYIKS